MFGLGYCVVCVVFVILVSLGGLLGMVLLAGVCASDCLLVTDAG